LFAFGSLIIFSGIYYPLNDKGENIQTLLMWLGSIIYLFAALMVYLYWKNSPHITIDKTNIKIGKKTYSLNNIKDVKLTGKVHFPFLLYANMEGTVILFNDETEKKIFDDMYLNSFEVKLFLDQVVVNKQEFEIHKTKKIKSSDLRLENTETFKGKQLLSLTGFSLWGVVGFFTFLLITKWTSLSIVVIILILLFGTFWFWERSRLLHYYNLSKNFLIVNNHILFWKMIIYRFSDIREVVFETQGQVSGIRLITNDYKSRLYSSAPLRNKTWIKMKKRLENEGVKVRDEWISK
tara:strand:- start:2559 stop:3437 length:879 start_codon:yes stop_codon:yes gene_type:complete